MDAWAVDRRRPLEPVQPAYDYRGNEIVPDAIVADHPSLVHGTLGAAGLRRGKSRFEWTTLSQESDAPRLQILGKPVPLYPPTSSPLIVPSTKTSHRQALEASKLLRTFYPDASLSFNVLRSQFAKDNRDLSKDLFDPLQGNKLSISRVPTVDSNEENRDELDVLAFPTGELGEDLNLSAFRRNIANECLQFVPDAVPLESFHNTILQVETHANQAGLIGVRTRDGLAFLRVKAVARDDSGSDDDDNEDHLRPFFEPSQLVRLFNDNLDKRTLVDLALSPVDDLTAIAASSSGTLYTVDLTQHIPAQKYAPNDTLEDHSRFRRLAFGTSPQGIYLATPHRLHCYDMREPASSTKSLVYQIPMLRDMFTSIESPKAEAGLMCCCTTRQLLWFDERMMSSPVLGVQHHRTRDRSVQAMTMNQPGCDTLVTLWSPNSPIVSLYDVDRGSDASLLHVFGTPLSLRCALPTRNGFAIGSSAITSATSADQAFSIFELGTRNEIVRSDVGVASDRQDGLEAQRLVDEAVGKNTRREGVFWDEAMIALDEKAKKMQPDVGNYAKRNVVSIELRDAYEHVFSHDVKTWTPEELEEQADNVHGMRELLPSVFQIDDSDSRPRTLFDLVQRAGNDPVRSRRSDWLTGSAFDSRAGHHSFARDGIFNSGIEKSRAVKWHFDIAPTLQTLDPTFPATSLSSSGGGNIMEDGADIQDAAKNAKLVEQLEERYALRQAGVTAVRRLREASQQLVIDNTLASHVFSDQSFINPTSSSQRAFAIGTQKGDEPPRVNFGFLGPHLKTTDENEDASPDQPLGVRLLLTEWTVGSDPDNYKYVDPYGLDDTREISDDDNELSRSASPSQPQPQSQSQRPRKPGTGSSQPKRPPTLAAAPPTLAAAPFIPYVGPKPRQSSVPPMMSHSQPLDSVAPVAGNSQSQDQSQETWPSTQVVPGPFGGRPAAVVAKKKVVKKRVGGF